MKFIGKENFAAFTNSLSKKYEIFYPTKVNEQQYEWFKLEDGKEISLEGFRTVLPAKYFFYSPRENLVEKTKKQTIIFGLRGCDIRGLELLKRIYLEEPKDPYFRTDILIFSADCTTFHTDCFCTILGDKPFAEEGFDLNFSCLEDGFLVEVGSDRGKEVLDSHSTLFEEATDIQKKAVIDKRTKVEEELKKQSSGKVLDLQNLKEKIEKNRAVFEEYGKNCVSCSSCTNICPGCFCFLLCEGEENKIRYSDSCQFKGYAKVAGGANPRKNLFPRFANRVYCKFLYRPEAQGLRGCTGCGRCISGCQGKINFREVLLKIQA